MKLKLVSNEREVSSLAADYIEQLVKSKPKAVLGLATGSTPIGTYQELIKRHVQHQLDFSQATTFNLDEYYGLEASHPQSYATFMRENLFNFINVQPQNIHIPSGTPENIAAYCKEYEKKIEQTGGIDLQLLGIGRNGHIGFNEPASELQPDTHLVQLAEETIKANARFFDREEDVPQFAVTMGIQTIMKAKKVLLLAIGQEKAEIIYKLVTSGITTDIPASLLKLHPDVTIIVDELAGSLVKEKSSLL